MGEYKRFPLEGQKRLSVDLDAHLMRMVKSKAAMSGISIKGLVVLLLRRWVAGEIKLQNEAERTGK